MSEGEVIISFSESMQVICDAIANHKTKKFLVGRLGGIELDIFVEYYNAEDKNAVLKSYQYNNLLKYCGYYDKKLSLSVLEKFMKHFVSYFKSCNIVQVANASITSFYGLMKSDNPYYSEHAINSPKYHKVLKSDVLGLPGVVKTNYSSMETLTQLGMLFDHLDGKRVLIVSPFEKEIRTQLQIKDKLFTRPNARFDVNKLKYPTFEKVEYINTFLTTNGFETPHDDFMQTVECYREQLLKKDFDIALVFCGAYTYPICDIVYNELSKSAIHLGGIGQLLFGIKGGSRFVTFEDITNEHWIYPMSEVNKNADGVPLCDGLTAYLKKW